MRQVKICDSLSMRLSYGFGSREPVSEKSEARLEVRALSGGAGAVLSLVFADRRVCPIVELLLLGVGLYPILRLSYSRWQPAPLRGNRVAACLRGRCRLVR